MNLYAIRDRLIDYYIEPAFFAPDDKNAMAALSLTVNGDSLHAITQTPHHFEIWRIGRFSGETGDLVQERELLCECSHLVRGDIRKKPDARTTRHPLPDNVATTGRGVPGSHASTSDGTGTGDTQGEAPKS